MPYVIRTSDRMQFKRCRQMWDFGSKIRQNYEPNQGIKALDFGTAIHKGLEVYYDPLTWNKSRQIKEMAALQAFLDIHTEQKVKVTINGEMPLEMETDWDERYELGIGMLKYYFDWAEEFETLTPIRTEVEFEVPVIATYNFFKESVHNLMHWELRDGCVYFCGEPVVYQGRVDLLGQQENGRYAIVDHKSTAQFGRTDWLDLDEQCTSYGWALEHLLGLDISSIVYSQLRKALAHPPAQLKNGRLSVNKQQNTTKKMFLAECARLNQDPKNYQTFIDFLADNPKEFVRRISVKRTRREYLAQSRRIFLEAVDMLSNPSIYPNPSPMNCNGCQFFRPCLATQDGGDVQWFLDELFTKRPEKEKESSEQ